MAALPQLPNNWHYYLAAFLAGYALPSSFDINYLVSFLSHILKHLKAINFRREPKSYRKAALEVFGPQQRPVIYHGRCQTDDLDHFRHMNNGKYFKHADFARFDLMLETGIIWASVEIGKNVVVQSVTMRYRKEFPLWQEFRVENRVVGWDRVGFFIEQRFVSTREKKTVVKGEGGTKTTTVEKKDILHGLLLSKIQLVKKGTVKDIFDKLELPELPATKIPPADVIQWAQSTIDAGLRVKGQKNAPIDGGASSAGSDVGKSKL